MVITSSVKSKKALDDVVNPCRPAHDDSPFIRLLRALSCTDGWLNESCVAGEVRTHKTFAQLMLHWAGDKISF